MEISFLLGFLVMWITIFWARHIMIAEIKKLDPDQKVVLVDLTTGRRSAQIAVLFVGIAAFYIITYFIDDHRDIWFGLYALFILIWLVYRMFTSNKLFRSHGFSEDFLKAQVRAGIVRLIGVIAIFASVVLNFRFY